VIKQLKILEGDQDWQDLLCPKYWRRNEN